MSFSYKFKTLRSGNPYNSRAQIEMSVHEEEVTEEVEADATEGNEENSTRFSPDLVEEKIKASLEMMDRLIQSNSAKETTAASSRETRHQYESPYSGVPESSSFPTVAPLNTSGYSPDNWSPSRLRYVLRSSGFLPVGSSHNNKRPFSNFQTG